MKRLSAVIERAEGNFSAYLREVDGITVTGKSIDEIKVSLTDAIEDYIDFCEENNIVLPPELQGRYEIVFELDICSLLSIYEGIFSKSGLEKLTGINQKQLWHYAKGISTPRPAQRQRIENALHRLGSELLSISL